MENNSGSLGSVYLPDERGREGGGKQGYSQVSVWSWS